MAGTNGGHDTDMMRDSGINRLSLVKDSRGLLVRREWPSVEVTQMLGISPESEVIAQQLAAAQDVAPPVVEFDAARRFILMPFVEGSTLETDWMLRRERRAAVRELLDRLRSISSGALPTLDLVQRLGELQERLARASALQAARWAQQVDEVIAKTRAVGPAGQVLVHGDLNPPNVIVRPDGSLYLIDWEYAHRGHADEDLAGLAAGSTAHAVELGAWSLQPEVFEARTRLRALLDAVWLDLAAISASSASAN